MLFLFIFQEPTKEPTKEPTMNEEGFDTSIENLRRIANESMDEIKKLTDEWISRDYSKWKCVDLRIRIHKKLEDKTQSRCGLSKWKK